MSQPQALPVPDLKPGQILPYKQLRDPAKFNTRREATEGRRIRAPKGAAEDVDIRSTNGGRPFRGKALPNRYLSIPVNHATENARRLTQRRGEQ